MTTPDILTALNPERNALERKVKDKFDDESDFEYYFSTPEDIIIAKLQWFVRGNRVSEHQWLDIIGVIKVQGENLDIRYPEIWSKKLGILNLLKKAFQESGMEFKV